MTKKVELKDIPEELEKLLSEFLRSSFDVRQKAVQAGAEVFKTAIENASPKDTGKFASSWKIKSKYKNHRYIGNSRLATKPVKRKKSNGEKGEARQGVPLSNILEYSENSPNYGFIRKCFDEVEPQIYQAIKNTIQNGGN